MGRADIDIRTQSLTGEVIETDADYLKVIYANMGIEEALVAYLDRTSDVGDPEIDLLLAGFSAKVAETASGHGAMDTGLIRFAFDHLTDNMNEVASRQFGYEQPPTPAKAILTRLGVKKPEPRRYVRGLDDRYWSKQFMEQYANGDMVQRQDGESEQQYLTRYTYACMHGFLFAPFTYLA